ncbi:hypothetical protein MPDQ_004060 [Monascus purpureus]|uniref:Uncharacterized protein n=1 Tax=Monascus purpureus TaxID=5098 RepID=A0A507QM69_MONPU|nr:hypothetical protein MPDQ_004060 [Monascus purpureus]BDD55976.1 hypothetical protein MAP00_001456 [Monascus purpureus]
MPRETRHGAAHSNVGSRALYEGQDQINDPQSVINERKRYGGGRASDDPIEIGQAMANQPSDKRRGREAEEELSKIDPTKPATFHGNKPSRGAEVDKSLMEDDELRMRERLGR